MFEEDAVTWLQNISGLWFRLGCKAFLLELELTEYSHKQTQIVLFSLSCSCVQNRQKTRLGQLSFQYKAHSAQSDYSPVLVKRPPAVISGNVMCFLSQSVDFSK